MNDRQLMWFEFMMKHNVTNMLHEFYMERDTDYRFVFDALMAMAED